MKKIYINEKGVKGKKPYLPFWMPWGVMGCFGRAFLFLLALLVFLWLLSLPRGCSKLSYIDELRSDNKEVDTLRIAEVEDSIMHSFDPEKSWPKDVPDSIRSEQLPDPDKNQIPPVNPEDVITSPEDSITRIDSKHLFAVLDSDAGDEIFNRFAEEFSQLYPKPECEIVYYNTLSKTLLLRVPAEKREQIKQNLPKQITDISFYVIEVEMLDLEMVPNDLAFDYPQFSWQFTPIQANKAWDITIGNPNVIVAIVDSYFELSHPDLIRTNFVEPYCVERGNRDVRPDPNAPETPYMHGTHVASIALGNMNNREGSTGIAPGCSFMPVSLGASPTNFRQLEGILYAIHRGATVINLSLGTNLDRDKIQQLPIAEQVRISRSTKKGVEHLWNYIFQLCDERNVMLVWSAGNFNGLTTLDESKRNNQTIKVSAVDQKLNKAGFSSFGNLPEYDMEYSTISAPGVDIVNAVPQHTYLPLSGTSMAAPIVTGAVALMKSINPNLTNTEIIQILQETAMPLNDKTIGGLLQIEKALKRVQQDLLSFDDVMKDHRKLIGTWQATRNLALSADGKTLGDLKLYMIFDSESHGTIKLSLVGAEKVYEAPLSVTFGTGSVRIEELSPATAPDGDNIRKGWYKCTPDKQGLLKVLNVQEGRDEDIYFYLKKVK